MHLAGLIRLACDEHPDGHVFQQNSPRYAKLRMRASCNKLQTIGAYHAADYKQSPKN